MSFYNHEDDYCYLLFSHRNILKYSHSVFLCKYESIYTLCDLISNINVTITFIKLILIKKISMTLNSQQNVTNIRTIVRIYKTKNMEIYQ